MPRPRPRTLRRAAVGTALLTALVTGLLAPPALAAPGDDVPTNTECPAVVSMRSVTEGMTGTGLTVVRGTEPKPFKVTVLGVLDNAIGAGHDMIVVQVDDFAGQDVVSAGGGIWAGMSGSPVYVGGKLLGAVAYGFSPATSRIGGVTPAADMVDLLGLPGAAAAKQAAQRRPATVSLDASDRRAIARRATAAVPSGAMRALPTPVALSGLSSKRIDRYQAEAEAAGLPLVAYAGSRAAAPTAAALTRPTAGGNFGAVQSYGDLTAAAFGTTTYVCGTQALAFGHPFGFAGPSSYGANVGSSLTIFKDPVYGSFKLAKLGAPVGTVDQDRLVGIRANLTRTPPLTPIRSTIRNLDDGRRRQGQTLAADRQQLPALTAFGLLSNYDVTFDEVGDGRASLDWTISGRRAGNKPFTIRRGNKIASQGDVSFEAALDPAYAVEALLFNEYEPVTIDRISVLSAISTHYRQYSITKAEVSVNGGKYAAPKLLRVKGGSTLRVRVTLRPYQSTKLKTTVLTMRVPRAKGRTGSLFVTGGYDLAQGGDEEQGCLLSPELCEDPGEGSLNSVISGLTNAWRNDEVAARLVLEPLSEGSKVIRKTAKNRQSEIVLGNKELAVEIR